MLKSNQPLKSWILILAGMAKSATFDLEKTKAIGKRYSFNGTGSSKIPPGFSDYLYRLIQTGHLVCTLVAIF